MVYDVIIVGGGPAGMSATLNLLRSGKDVLIIEKESFGGKINLAPCVENFPGFEKISGLEFTQKFLNQIKKLGMKYKIEEVLNVSKNEDNQFEVQTNLNKYYSKSVIIAIGTQKRELNLGEKQFIGKGVSYCAVCDGVFYKNKDVCVIGDGNTALQYSLYLSNICRKVYLCTLSNSFSGDNILVNKIKKTENIFIKHNVKIEKIIGTDKLEKVIFFSKEQNKNEELKISCLFIAIGQMPNDDIYKNLVELDNNFICVDEKFETKTKGLFAIGDCIKKTNRQLVTATSDGSTSAFYVNFYVSKMTKKIGIKNT